MKNAYRKDGDQTIVSIESDKYGYFEVIIDTEDLDKVKEASSWAVSRRKSIKSFYVTGKFKNNGKYTSVLLHRHIMGEIDSRKQIDHIRHNTFDNRKKMLRVVSNSENSQNQRKGLSNKSGFMGVSWYKASNKWRANIYVNGKQKYLGLFDSLEEARQTRLDAEKEYWEYKSYLLNINESEGVVKC